MGFIDSYKHLEKLCGDVMNDERRVSAYIDEMLRTHRGAYLVRGWDDDLKQLKHYRWVRNQIAHELNCSEENMCDPEDTQWLDDFYYRIMNQTDPLALYRKAMQPQTTTVPPKPVTQTYVYPTQSDYSHKEKSKKPVGCVIFSICIFAIIAVMITLVASMVIQIT